MHQEVFETMSTWVITTNTMDPEERDPLLSKPDHANDPCIGCETICMSNEHECIYFGWCCISTVFTPLPAFFLSWPMFKRLQEKQKVQGFEGVVCISSHNICYNPFLCCTLAAALPPSAVLLLQSYFLTKAVAEYTDKITRPSVFEALFCAPCLVGAAMAALAAAPDPDNRFPPDSIIGC